MGLGRKVRTNSTVSSVGSSSSLDGSLHGKVRDEASINVQALSLGVSLEILEELAHVSN